MANKISNTQAKLEEINRMEMIHSSTLIDVIAHLKKLIFARRDTFLYKHSGVVMNCDGKIERNLIEFLLHHVSIIMRSRQQTRNAYQRHEKHDKESHGAHRSAPHRKEAHENLGKCVSNDCVVGDHRQERVHELEQRQQIVADLSECRLAC